MKTVEPTITVAILGGDPAVARALEHLLSGAGYAARILPDPLSDELGKALAGTGLLLLAPALHAAQREALLDLASATGVPSLELPWLCGVEDLKLAIEGALSADSGADA